MTTALENIETAWAKAADEADDLREINAALVAALQGLLSFCPAETKAQDRKVLAARAAIARATGAP